MLALFVAGLALPLFGDSIHDAAIAMVMQLNLSK
jgi:hypothetical protein